MDTKKQRQSRCDDVRLTESGNAKSEQIATCDACRAANRLRMAARGALEWNVRRSGWFLGMKYQTCFLKDKSEHNNELWSVKG